MQRTRVDERLHCERVVAARRADQRSETLAVRTTRVRARLQQVGHTLAHLHVRVREQSKARSN